MKLVAVTRINADIAGTAYRAAKGATFDAPDDHARVLLDAGQARIPDVSPPTVTPLHGFPVAPDGTVTFRFATSKEESVVDKLVARVREAAKAVAAVVTPIATTALLEAVGELSTSNDVLVASIATAIAVYLVPNKART